ncbi:MAG: EVE domain-containing protein [Gemmataceae bacterium]
MTSRTAKKMYWYFNTDESESEGEGAHQRMIDQSCIAAWGRCIRHGGAKETLRQPQVGDTVFLYRAGYGIVAMADVADETPTRSETVFPDGNREYKRAVCKMLRAEPPLSYSEIRDATGYHLPCRHILCPIHDNSAVKYILTNFANTKKQKARHSE